MGLIADRMKTIAKSITPEPLLRQIRPYLLQRWDAKFERQPAVDVFAAVYREGKWGGNPDQDFYSGGGSHKEYLVIPYIDAVRGFLRTLTSRPSVVDLGCGDFNVGSQLRPSCGRYVACDVVPDLIRRNRTKFSGLQVDFRCIDIIEDDLPDGEVVFLRQVLQHLSNAQIVKIVQKLYSHKFLVLTEHIPAKSGFPPNLDKSNGHCIRLSQGSGIVLTEPPFDLNIRSEAVLCSVPETNEGRAGVVRTTLYELAPASLGDSPKELRTLGD
jgi:SAM-dependent methyltransferase